MQRKADVRKRNARRHKQHNPWGSFDEGVFSSQSGFLGENDMKVYVRKLVIHTPHNPGTNFKITDRELTHSLADLQDYLNRSLQMDIEIIVKKATKLEMF